MGLAKRPRRGLTQPTVPVTATQRLPFEAARGDSARLQLLSKVTTAPNC